MQVFPPSARFQWRPISGVRGWMKLRPIVGEEAEDGVGVESAEITADGELVAAVAHRFRRADLCGNGMLPLGLVSIMSSVAAV